MFLAIRFSKVDGKEGEDIFFRGLGILLIFSVIASLVLRR
jgi:hypothetical protein